MGSLGPQLQTMTMGDGSEAPAPALKPAPVIRLGTMGLTRHPYPEGSTIEIVNCHGPNKDHLALPCFPDDTASGDENVHKIHTSFWDRQGGNTLYAGSRGTVTKVLDNNDIQVRWDPEHMVDTAVHRATLDFNEMTWESDNATTIHFPPQDWPNAFDHKLARWPMIKCISPPTSKQASSLPPAAVPSPWDKTNARPWDGQPRAKQVTKKPKSSNVRKTPYRNPQFRDEEDEQKERYGK